MLSGVAADTAQEPRKLKTSPRQKARAECSQDLRAQGSGKTANADCEGSDSFQVSDGHRNQLVVLYREDPDRIQPRPGGDCTVAGTRGKGQD